jgi:hypothetical protein
MQERSTAFVAELRAGWVLVLAAGTLHLVSRLVAVVARVSSTYGLPVKRRRNPARETAATKCTKPVLSLSPVEGPTC